MRFDLGLTGSIGMGKSTTAQLFADRGCAIWDADAAVHALYRPRAAGTQAIKTICPDAVTNTGVDRSTLKTAIAQDRSLLHKVEQVIHPLVLRHRNGFRADHPNGICVYDIPLLYEGGSQTEFDAVACVHVPPDQQRERVLARGTMDLDTFEMILGKQMPNEQKTALADFVIDTTSHASATRDVDRILQDIHTRMA